MIIKNLPIFIFADERRGPGEAKFIVVSICDQYFLAVEMGPTTHGTIRRDLHEMLRQKDFHGRYSVHGGGKIDLSDDATVWAGDISGDFGNFDEETVKAILEKEFPDKKVMVDGLPRLRDGKAFVM